MCTATYIPLAKGGFVLTHSRDEKTVRPSAHPPKVYVQGGQEIIFPKDPQWGGTWIASSAQTTVCLLNGAFEAHQQQPPYRHSRGLVPFHVFNYKSVDDFLRQYDPGGLEPFTLLLAQTKRLVEVRWTGERLFVQDKSPDQPHIWSSVTLYSPDIIEKREGWFGTWQQQNPQPAVSNIRQFHLLGGEGDAENAIRMNRHGVLMTLSLTSVVHRPEATDILYDDFIKNIARRFTLNHSDYATA